MFTPDIEESITIGDVVYQIAAHPTAPTIPYGQEGRAAKVFKILRSDGEAFALKVFKPPYRKPLLAGRAPKLATLSHLPGLKVCKRTVLSPLSHGDLIKQYPDLLYAVVMPWIEGATWHDVIGEKKPLLPEQSLSLARALAHALTTMEEQGIAHCDISSANVLLPGLLGNHDGNFPVELVDIEQLYDSALQRPDPLAAGTPGYVPKGIMTESLWNATGDRFAGAMLIAELLGWCDDRVRSAAYEESYFQQTEIQTNSQRYKVLVEVLQERWGQDVARRFSSAWKSQSLVECPLFGDWLVSLPSEILKDPTKTVPIPESKHSTPAVETSEVTSEKSIQLNEITSETEDLITIAQQYEQQGDSVVAIEIYSKVLESLPQENDLAQEIRGIVENLKRQVKGLSELPQVAKQSGGLRRVSRGQMFGIGITLLAIATFALIQSGVITIVIRATPTVTPQSSLTAGPASIADATSTVTPRPTSTPSPTPAPTATPTSVPMSSILYSEDFEDGVADAWGTSVGEWKIEDEIGNHFWVGTGPDNYPQAWLDNELDPTLNFSDWKDYAFEVDVRFPQKGTLFMCARADGGAAFYNVSFGTYGDLIQFADYDGTETNDGSNYQTFGSARYNLTLHRWYTVRFEVKGTLLRFYIDDKLVATASRDTWQKGGIGFYMGGGDKINFDNIRVWSLASP